MKIPDPTASSRKQVHFGTDYIVEDFFSTLLHQDSDLCEYEDATHPLVACVLITASFVENLRRTSR